MNGGRGSAFFGVYRWVMNMVISKGFSLVLVNAVLLLCFSTLHADGLDFKQLMRAGEMMKYQHWNIKKKKVTGFTIVRIEEVGWENKPNILEINQNRRENGALYLEKRSWFDLKTGVLHRYVETDMRTGIEVVNSIENNRITTQIKEKNQIKEFTVDMESDLVPFEVLTLSLRKELPRLLKEQSYNFTLYLPIIASELSKKGLPLSLSKLSMVASVETFREVDCVLGTLDAVQILVKPGSFFITTLLPKEKSEFRFIFALQRPYYLLSFEEGETRSSLIGKQNLRN